MCLVHIIDEKTVLDGWDFSFPSDVFEIPGFSARFPIQDSPFSLMTQFFAFMNSHDLISSVLIVRNGIFLSCSNFCAQIQSDPRLEGFKVNSLLFSLDILRPHMNQLFWSQELERILEEYMLLVHRFKSNI